MLKYYNYISIACFHVVSIPDISSYIYLHRFYPAESLRKIHRSFHSVADLNGFCRLLQIYSIISPKMFKMFNMRTIKANKQTNGAMSRKSRHKRTTFHFHHWSHGVWLGMLPNVHNRQGLAWRHCECTVHIRDTVDKWAVEGCLLWRRYRRTKRDSV